MLFRLQEGIAMKMHSHKHILIYDRLWWIQGQRAQLLQKHHPHLEIMSYRDFMNLIKHKGANRINQQYDVVSTLGLWSAERFIQRNVHVHSSVVGSYSYVAKNQHYFREWSNEMRPNYKYMKQVIQKIDRVEAVNPNLAPTIKKYFPNKQVNNINPFVNKNKFKPLRSENKKDKSTFTIGWLVNSNKQPKNYHTIYQSIKNH